MPRSWLEVTTGEVQSRQADNERLAKRREVMAERAWQLVESMVAPAFQRRAEAMGNREYRVAGDSEWSVVRCGIYAPGSVEQDPTVAFHEAEFDAYQPLVVLRCKADGAGAVPHARTVHVDKLNDTILAVFLNG